MFLAVTLFLTIQGSILGDEFPLNKASQICWLNTTHVLSNGSGGGKPSSNVPEQLGPSIQFHSHRLCWKPKKMHRRHWNFKGGNHVSLALTHGVSNWVLTAVVAFDAWEERVDVRKFLYNYLEKNNWKLFLVHFVLSYLLWSPKILSSHLSYQLPEWHRFNFLSWSRSFELGVVGRWIHTV